MSETETQVALPSQPSPAYRWFVLVVISLAMFGNYYVYDAISPLADVLRDLWLGDDALALGRHDAHLGKDLVDLWCAHHETSGVRFSTALCEQRINSSFRANFLHRPR